MCKLLYASRYSIIFYMHILSLFPSLFYLAPLSATILRAGAGIACIYIGYALILNRREITQITLPFIGHPARWMIMVSGVITILDGLALIIGFGTQAAAIIGIIIALKHLLLPRTYESIRPLARSTYALLILMSLTLILTGAGPFAFDLPL